MKYLLFMFDGYSPSGGVDDFIFEASTVKKCFKYLSRIESSFEDKRIYQIVNKENMSIVKSGLLRDLSSTFVPSLIKRW